MADSKVLDLLAADANATDTIESAIAVLAASKAVAADAKESRKLVAPGTYEVSTTLRVTSTVKVGEDYTQRIVAKADPWGLLAVALSKLNGVTVDAIVREALDVDAQDVKATKASAAAAIGELKAPTETVCAGKVTATGSALVLAKEVRSV